MRQGFIKSTAIILSIIMALTVFPLLGGMQGTQAVYAENEYDISITPENGYWTLFSDDYYKKYEVRAQGGTENCELEVKVGTGYPGWENWDEVLPEEVGDDDLWFFYDGKLSMDGTAIFNYLKDSGYTTITIAAALIEYDYDEEPEIHALETVDVNVSEPVWSYSFAGDASDMFKGTTRKIMPQDIHWHVVNADNPGGYDGERCETIQKVTSSDTSVISAVDYTDYWKLTAKSVGEVDLTIKFRAKGDGPTAEVVVPVKVSTKRVKGTIYNDKERYFAVPGDEPIALHAKGKYETSSGTSDSSNIDYAWFADDNDTNYIEVVEDENDPSKATVYFKKVGIQEPRTVKVWVEMTYTKDGTTGRAFHDWITLTPQYYKLCPDGDNDEIDNIHIGQTITIHPQLKLCRYNEATEKAEQIPVVDDVEYRADTQGYESYMTVKSKGNGTFEVKRLKKNGAYLNIEANIGDDEYQLPIYFNPIRTDLKYYTIEVSDLENGHCFYLDSPEQTQTPSIKLVDRKYNYVLPTAEYKLTVKKLANNGFPAKTSSSNVFRFDYNPDNPNAKGSGIATYTVAASATASNTHGFTGSAKPAVDKIDVYSNKTLTAPAGTVTVSDEFAQYKKSSTLFAARYDLPAGVSWTQSDFIVKVGKNQDVLDDPSKYNVRYKNISPGSTGEIWDEFPTKAGAYDCIVTGQEEYYGSQTIDVFIGKTNPAVVKVSPKTVRVKKLKKKALSVSPISITKKVGTVKCTKLSGSNKLTVKSNGKVVVKKKTKKGTYTAMVKIVLGGTSTYAPEMKKVKITVKVKK